MKKKLLIATIVLLILLLMAGGVWRQIKMEGDRRLLIQQETLFTLAAGTTQMELARQLEQQKLLDNTFWLPLLTRIEPELGKLKAGTYRLTPGMTLRQFLLLLHSGKEEQFSIRFIEGSRLEEWLAELAAAPYLRHDLQGQSVQQIAAKLNEGKLDYAEGWLYPDTYFYTAGTREEVILQRAHKRMRTVLDTIWRERAADLPYRTPQDLLIMASIIEKETGVADERNKVASVFINRLRLGMRLQTDPTVIYGLGADYKGTLSRKDLQSETPYNTYVHEGLPPTPIAMPGKASLLAAAHPASTDYLYFVADGQGGHTFSTNLNSHNQAVRHYINTLRQKSEQ
ncbi:MAG: endolytic transglycosylase MltG [Enterobacteriaceae bacterium]